MTISNDQILTWLGITDADSRRAIEEDFLSEGLEGLENMSDADVKDVCSSYAKRTDEPFPVILTPLERQRMKSLTLWVKDMVRVGLEPEFEDDTTRVMFIEELKDALSRDRRRKEQKKVGESFHDHSFTTKLKTQAQWEKFSEELEATLSMIVGVCGAPLSYVIRADEQPNFDFDISYDEAVVQAVPLEGDEFRLDARTVHQLIISNVVEDSDAYTYIKTLLRHRDGRRDILALRMRYENDATKQAIINSAKASLEGLRYKNERGFTFEKFSSKLQKAYDELADNGREVNNGDIVDSLWARIQNPDIQMYLSSLKVDYQKSPRSYKLILQDIAAEVATKKQVTFHPRLVTGVSGVSTYTRQGTCPSQGVHTPEGAVFIGNYDRNKWHHDSVKPYHQEILQARSSDGGGNAPSRGQKRRVNALKRNQKKLKRLNEKIAAAKATLQEATKDKETPKNDNKEKPNDAGNAFGGKNSKK